MISGQQSNSIINEIAQRFAAPNRPNYVDIKALRTYLDKQQQSDNIFQRKLRQLGSTNEMQKQEFKRFFNPGIKSKQHFDDVFAIIDTDNSGYIARSELVAANREYRLGLSEADIETMMRHTSRDMQKVKKEDLFDFITKDQ